MSASPTKFWLESARLVLKKHTSLFVNIETGLPVINQDAVGEFVALITEDEAEWLRLASANEELRLWRDNPLDRLDCTVLDMQTANVLVTVHTVLSPPRQAKFAQLPLTRAVEIAWKCVK